MAWYIHVIFEGSKYQSYPSIKTIFIVCIMMENSHTKDSILNMEVEFMINIHWDAKTGDLKNLWQQNVAKMTLQNYIVEEQNKNLIRNRKMEQGYMNPKSAEISNLYLEVLDARFPCQAMKNSVLKHLSETDVTLYVIGTRFPGQHQMQGLARRRAQRIWGHHLHPPASSVPPNPGPRRAI